jgi:hypothetical protein
VQQVEGLKEQSFLVLWERFALYEATGDFPVRVGKAGR